MAGNVDRMKSLSALSYGNVKGVEQRRVASEETLGLLRKNLGAPGTYDLPDPNANPNTNEPVSETPVQDGMLTRGSLTFVDKGKAKKYDKLIKKGYSQDEAKRLMGGQFDESAGGGLFKNVKNVAAPGGLGVGGGKGVGTHAELDPQAAAEQLQDSSAGRQVSRMMAESEQLLARSGPLYDEMIRNTQLPIIESSAAAARENTEALRKAMARGGSARRDAFEAIQKMRSQDQLNMQRGQALADAHMKLDVWSRENAKNVIKFADDWSANQAGVRDSFNTAMDQAAELMSSSALPFMYMTQNKAQEYRDANSAARRGKVNKWISGSLGLVVGAVGAFYGGSGESMKQFGDMSGKGDTPASGGSPGLIQAGKDLYGFGKSVFSGGEPEADTTVVGREIM